MKHELPEPSMLELRGALDLLHDANRKLSDERLMIEHRENGASLSERTRLRTVYNDASFIISNASYLVSAQLRAVLGQNKEYAQAAALGRL